MSPILIWQHTCTSNVLTIQDIQYTTIKEVHTGTKHDQSDSDSPLVNSASPSLSSSPLLGKLTRGSSSLTLRILRADPAMVQMDTTEWTRGTAQSQLSVKKPRVNNKERTLSPSLNYFQLVLLTFLFRGWPCLWTLILITALYKFRALVLLTPPPFLCWALGRRLWPRETKHNNFWNVLTKRKNTKLYENTSQKNTCVLLVFMQHVCQTIPLTTGIKQHVITSPKWVMSACHVLVQTEYLPHSFGCSGNSLI